MAVSLHRNDNAREAAPSVGPFRGRWVVLLVVTVAAGLAIFKILDRWQVPILANVVISAVPASASIAWVLLLVNGKAQSYAGDLLDWWQFLLVEWLFVAGWKDAPPVFGARESASPRHPRNEK